MFRMLTNKMQEPLGTTGKLKPITKIPFSVRKYNNIYQLLKIINSYSEVDYNSKIFVQRL